MIKMFRAFLLLLMVSLALSAENVYFLNEGYTGITVSCSTQKEAENLAVRFLLRGNQKYLANKEKYSYTAGVLTFVPLRQVSVIQSLNGKEVLFIIEVLVNKRMFIISRIPAIIQPQEDPHERNLYLAHAVIQHKILPMRKTSQGVRHG